MSFPISASDLPAFSCTTEVFHGTGTVKLSTQFRISTLLGGEGLDLSAGVWVYSLQIWHPLLRRLWVARDYRGIRQ